MKVGLIRKSDMNHLEINNVIQIDFCNTPILENDISANSVSFLSIFAMENGEKKRHVFEINDVWLFSVVCNNETKEQGNDNKTKTRRID